MKGVILAGGAGTRLYPCTISVSKQLLPIYDKPLIYYPLSMLLLAKIRDILIISTPRDIEDYKRLLGDGSRIGVHFEYAVQETPRGLADAFIVGEQFIGNDSVCLVLGDNVFYGAAMSEILAQAKDSIKNGGAAIFGCFMKNPQDFGVVEFDENKKVVSIEEKPKKPKSNYAVPGLYFYDNDVIRIAKSVQPSARGEIEISSVNEAYMNRNQLHVTLMGRGVSWFDTGSPKGMHKASGFVKTLQEMQGFYISCIEEIAWRKKLIDDEQLKKCGEELKQTDYGKYLLSLLNNEEESG
ncbi:MAG: glucose-1-phosphate thymidylyltransferase RfbA [Oscillospiraceae bacterium]|nr:glucose-1-phosphate thymidylyltransferase RfbA [Oscillospiraceae bacterium]